MNFHSKFALTLNGFKAINNNYSNFPFMNIMYSLTSSVAKKGKSILGT